MRKEERKDREGKKEGRKTEEASKPITGDGRGVS